MTKEEWDDNKDRIEFVYSNNSYFSELKNMELLRERFSLATEAESYIGEYLSRRWMYNNVFKFSDAEIATMKKEIEKEQDDGEITPDDFGNAGAELKVQSSSNSSPKFSATPSPPESKEKTDDSKQEDEEPKNEQVVLDESDVISSIDFINNKNTKTVSKLLENFSEVEDGK